MMDQTSTEKVTRLMQGTVGEVCPKVVDYTDEFGVRSGVGHSEADAEDCCDAEDPKLTAVSMEAATPLESNMDKSEVELQQEELTQNKDFVQDEPEGADQPGESAAQSTSPCSTPEPIQVAPVEPPVTETEQSEDLSEDAETKSACSSTKTDEDCQESSEKDSTSEVLTDGISESKDEPKNLNAADPTNPASSVAEVDTASAKIDSAKDTDKTEGTQKPDQRNEKVEPFKKRRRRKPSKVSKQAYIQDEGLSDLSLKMSTLGSYDQNFNSLEMEPKTKQEDLSSNEHSLVNSLVAHAMKIWYDDELPRAQSLLQSPMKDRALSMAKLRVPGCLKIEADEGRRDGTQAVDFTAIKNLKMCSQDSALSPNAPQKCHQENQNETHPLTNGVAPDDQFYSMPSSVPQDSGPNTSWKPNKTVHSSLLSSKPYMDVSPVATPLLAKAMQSLRVPSPSVSPSLGSDQESPNVGPKLYLCNICNKSFTFATNLTRHQRNIHGRPCRRRTKEGVGNEDRDFSASSDDMDHHSERRGGPLRANTPLDSAASISRIAPNFESMEPEPKMGRYSPSVTSWGHGEPNPHKNILPSYLTPPQREQEYVVITPKEKVSCSLCLSTFESPNQLSRHEATCRGIDRTKVFSDASGAIDLSKPKASEHKPSPKDVTAFKPKFNYLHSESFNMAAASKTLDSPLNLTSTSYFPHQGPLSATGEKASNLSLAQRGFFPIMDQVVPSDLKMLSSVATGDMDVPTRRPHKCAFCKKRFSTYKSLAKHTSFVHKVNLAGMQHLGDSTSMVALATAEMELLAEQSGRPLNLTNDGHNLACQLCRLCGQTFSSLTNLRHHIRYIHLGIKDGVSRSNTSSPDVDVKAKTSDWVCDLCGQNFASKRNLNRHLNHVHKLNRNGVKDGSESKKDVPKEVLPQHEGFSKLARVPLASSPLVIAPIKSQSEQPPVSERKPDQVGVPPVSSVHHLQDVVDRVLSREEGLIRGRCSPQEDIIRGRCSPQEGLIRGRCSPQEGLIRGRCSPQEGLIRGRCSPAEDRPKLPHKKAIMEEYQKETHMKMKLEQEQKMLRLAEMQRASPILDLSQGSVTQESDGLDLSTHSVQDRRQDRAMEAQVVPVSKPEPSDLAAMDLSNGKSQRGGTDDSNTVKVNEAITKVTPCSPALDLSQEKPDRKVMPSKECGKDYQMNPFSAILNLSQTYLRKLLNDTPASPGLYQSDPHMASFSSTKDKENSMDEDIYTRSIGYPKSNPSYVREYHPAETSKLREMLTSKLPGFNGTGNGEFSPLGTSSHPSSGRGSPMNSSFDDERRPLMMSSMLENQPKDHSYSGNDISPLRNAQNKSIRKKLKETILDQKLNSAEKKLKNQRKRKSMEHSTDVPLREKLLDSQESLPKKIHKEALEEKQNFDSNGNLDVEKSGSIDSIKMGEFPAIAVGKRHICGLCGASFTFQTNLTRHQRKLHGKPFVRKSSLNQTMNVENLKVKEEPQETGPVPVQQETV